MQQNGNADILSLNFVGSPENETCSLSLCGSLVSCIYPESQSHMSLQSEILPRTSSRCQSIDCTVARIKCLFMLAKEIFCCSPSTGTWLLPVSQQRPGPAEAPEMLQSQSIWTDALSHVYSSFPVSVTPISSSGKLQLRISPCLMQPWETQVLSWHYLRRIYILIICSTHSLFWLLWDSR